MTRNRSNSSVAEPGAAGSGFRIRVGSQSRAKNRIKEASRDPDRQVVCRELPKDLTMFEDRPQDPPATRAGSCQELIELIREALAAPRAEEATA